MVEIYLFVNPLGGVCLEIEKEIMDEVRVRLADCEFVFEDR